MQCNQLLRLIKNWYTHVKQETMAPARMMQFVDDHVKECNVCRDDHELIYEIDKIREYVLPDSKLPRAFRSPQSTLTPDIFPTVEKKEEQNASSPSDATKDNLF
ncbi:MAG: hypothetical protein D3923_18295 [Candidatus Electrothrix sp. AR3]|nr:hypothetical protein [Candidatus Electrothrix sp. AR3]